MDQQMPNPYDTPLYQPTQLTGPTGNTQYPQSGQLGYQQQQLQNFWANQYQEIGTTTDFRTHSLPLARIKKVMKLDEGVRMISAEAPVVFARACEMFVLELTLRSWNHTEENKRRTLHRNDIAAAIANTDLFDFLVRVVPRDDPGEGASYFYMPPQQSPQLYASPQQMWPHQQPE